MPKINLNPSLFHALQKHCASDEVSRYYLRGVCLQRHPKGGVVMVATDGHILGAYHDPAADGSVLADRGDVILKARRADFSRIKVAETLEVTIDLDAPPVPDFVSAVVTRWGEQFPLLLEIVDASYPNWRAVLPKQSELRKEYNGLGLGVAVLNPLVGILRDLRDYGAHGVQIFSSGKDGTGPALVKITGDTNLLLVAMPFRSDLDNRLPAWIEEWI